MKPNLERIDQLIAAAQAWREFQYPDSIDDQKSDRRLRGDALDARDRLLQEIDMLENEPSDCAADSARVCRSCRGTGYIDSYAVGEGRWRCPDCAAVTVDALKGE
jgi:hypothetical protein